MSSKVAIAKTQEHPGTVIVKVGQVVLFRIDKAEWRPLLVVKTGADGVVSGELFLDWEEDRHSEWVRKHMFFGPHQERRSVEIRGVVKGPEVGQWEVMR